MILYVINPLLSDLLNWRLSRKYLFLRYRPGGQSQVLLTLDKRLWKSMNCLAHLTELTEGSQRAELGMVCLRGSSPWRRCLLLQVK